MELTKKFKNDIIFLIGIILFVVYPNSSVALPYGSGTYGSCQYSSCGISVSTGGTVNLSVTPTSSGVYTTTNDTITVITGSSTGYTLSFKDNDTNTNLENGSEVVATHSGTQASPTGLSMNTWGYRVDGLSGFGVGPTSAQNSQSSSSYTFAGIPASNQTAHTLKTTSVPATPSDTATVWYGVRIDTAIPAGTYTDQVVYTAVTNN